MAGDWKLTIQWAKAGILFIDNRNYNKTQCCFDRSRPLILTSFWKRIQVLLHHRLQVPFGLSIIKRQFLAPLRPDIAWSPGRYAGTGSAMPNLVDSDCGLRDYFVDYRKAKTVNVIPYDPSLPQKPVSETPLGNHSSKKVTVVGMGQVGLGCVAAILNQDRCWFQAIYLLHILHVIYIYNCILYNII